MITLIGGISTALVLAGTVLLIISYWVVLKIIRELPAGGSFGRQWGLLASFIGCFAVGYIAFLFLTVGLLTSRQALSLVVPTIFCLGGMFVLVVTRSVGKNNPQTAARG